MFYGDPDELDRRQLDETAHQLDEAAAVLRRHAQEVRETIAKITMFERAVAHWFSNAVTAFDQAVDEFDNLVSDIAHGVVRWFGGGQPEPPAACSRARATSAVCIHRYCIVPHLDARDNPATANRTTVTFDNQTDSASGNHALDGNYVAAAGQLDSSKDPSVQAFRDSAKNFFNGSQVETHQYQVKRG